MDLSNLTIQKARHLLDTKKITSVDLTEYYLDQIAKKNKDVNAFITVTRELALAQARNADERLRNGEISGKSELEDINPGHFPPSPLNIRSNAGVKVSLLGIPYAIKDSFNTKGILTTAGSKMLSNYISPYDATVVKKLQNAGAVLLGKTNMDAWGHGSSTENSDYGITKNPSDLSRVAGGSSGGSAAAVAADMCVFSIGEDTGGSIRQPAGFCGVYGLKVTYGKVSRYGCVAYASSLDTVGPMAKCAEDIQIVLDMIKGSDEFDATTQDLTSKKDVAESIAKNKSLKGIKFALPKEYNMSEGLDLAVKNSLDSFIEKIEKAGGEILRDEKASIPSTKYCIPVYYVIAMAETSANLARYDGIRFGKNIETGKGWMENVIETRTENFSAEAKRRIMLGNFVLSSGYYDAYYGTAQKVRTKLIQEFDSVFTNADVIISPISPTPAFTVGTNSSDPVSMYLEDVFTVTANLVGVPSIAVPAGKSDSSLPVGMQILGPKWSEDMLIEIAKILEK